MRILLTNDDGYESEGLRALAAALRERHEVWVVAPDRNRSGVSHGLTLGEPLSFREMAPREYTCSGLPVDCAIAGMQGILPCLPDLVVSGINRGANIGTDIVYSGTAAAARQSVIDGVPGIAFSLASKTEEYLWEPLARFALENLDALVSLCSAEAFVNVNAPSRDRYRGARLTGVSRRIYRESVVMYDGPHGGKCTVFRGGTVSTDGDGDSDWVAVEEGFVSVARILAEPVAAPGGTDTPSFAV
jgi:5'-nucleotidase